MNTVVVAGAGAGKTYALVQEYISALFGFNSQKTRIHPTAILAVTFTEKAAAEMRTRVVTQLLEIAREQKFADWMYEKSLEYDVCLPSAKELRTMSRFLLTAPICTFHAFCAQVIRDHSMAAGISADFTLLAPIDENEIAFDLAQRVVVDALNAKVDGVNSLVTRFQMRRLYDNNGLCDNLVRLNNYLTEHGIDFSEIKIRFRDQQPLFEDEKFKTLKYQLRVAFDEFKHAPSSVKIAERLGRIEESYLRFLGALTKPEDLEIRISACFQNLRSLVKGRFGNDELRQNLVRSIVMLGSYLCNYFTMNEAKTVCFLLEQFSLKLNDYKNNFAALGFSDLLSRARDILRNNLAVRKEVKAKFGKILVDEFQDTSPMQEDLVALICEDKKVLIELLPNEKAMSHVPLERDMLFIVGDPKQSIYGFRGADVSLFDHTLKIITQGNKLNSATGVKKSLTLCRRSQSAVVELVNLVGRQTLSLPEAGIYFGDDDCLSALRPQNGNAGAIWKVDIDASAAKSSTMSKVLAEQINQLVLENNAKWNEVVILVRRIKMATPILLALKQLHIPAVIFGGDGFFTRAEVMDILAALKLAVDPEDSLATLTVLRSNLVGLSDADLIVILDQIPNWNGGVSFAQIIKYLDGIKLNPDVKNRIMAFAKVIESIRSKLGVESVAQAIDKLLEEGGYVLALSIEEDADDRLANILKLRSMLVAVVKDSVIRINQLWDRLDNPPKESLAKSSNANFDAVQIMTIHQSKGLEFNYVILADILSADPNNTNDIDFHPEFGLALTYKKRPVSVCSPQTAEEKTYAPSLIDLIRQKRKRASQEELARLLYVALIRAREKIFILDLQVDGKKTVDRGVNLRQLFYAGKKTDEIRFNELMPSFLLKPRYFEEKLCSIEKEAKLDISIFKNQLGLKKRLTASQIKLSANSKTYHVDAAKGKTKKEGNLAHKLIALVGSNISYDKNMDAGFDADLVLNKLYGAARQLGFIIEEKGVEDAIKACLKTLLGPIASLKKEECIMQFEMPLYHEENDYVLEGYADLVVISSKRCIVIDFKSSENAARSKLTKLQLQTYAAALKQRLSLPIYYCACVIGDESPLYFSYFE
ncbi:MAG: UvrD-helicase domain-containing protein [bacterium]|nr:UvrD-helicase domain-containing protein [bacterium]